MQALSPPSASGSPGISSDDVCRGRRGDPVSLVQEVVGEQGQKTHLPVNCIIKAILVGRLSPEW